MSRRPRRGRHRQRRWALRTGMLVARLPARALGASPSLVGGLPLAAAARRSYRGRRELPQVDLATRRIVHAPGVRFIAAPRKPRSE